MWFQCQTLVTSSTAQNWFSLLPVFSCSHLFHQSEARTWIYLHLKTKVNFTEYRTNHKYKEELITWKNIGNTAGKQQRSYEMLKEFSRTYTTIGLWRFFALFFHLPTFEKTFYIIIYIAGCKMCFFNMGIDTFYTSKHKPCCGNSSRIWLKFMMLKWAGPSLQNALSRQRCLLQTMDCLVVMAPKEICNTHSFNILTGQHRDQANWAPPHIWVMENVGGFPLWSPAWGSAWS